MRAMAASGDAFRVREEATLPSGSTYTYYHGPYATVGTAKAQATRRKREIRRYGRGLTSSVFTVEKTSTDWQEISA